MQETTTDAISRVLKRHPEIRLALLFGSVARGRAGPDSDLDLAVDVGYPLSAAQKMTLVTELAASTGRPIDLIDLSNVGEPLLGQILRHGKRLIGLDATYAELLTRHWFDEADFMPYYRRILASRRATWIGK